MTDRMEAYLISTADGGIVVDIEAMMLDVLIVMKSGGISKEECVKQFADLYDDIVIEVDTSVEVIRQPKGKRQ